VGGGPAPPVFATFLSPDAPFAPNDGIAVHHFDLAVGSSTIIGYDWDSDLRAWRRSTDGKAHLSEGGGQIAPTTVIVQYITYEATEYFDTTGAPVNEGMVVGTGEAAIFAAGKMVNARWVKANGAAMTTWTDLRGVPLRLPTGRTWIELPAIGAPLVTR